MRWRRRPEGSNWGDFGPDDQLGRMTLLTRDVLMKGIAEVKAGKSFCLSLPLDLPGGTVVNPRRHPPQLLPTIREGMPNINYPLNRDNPRLLDVSCDDIVQMSLQYSTQWDSFAHVGQHFDADADGRAEMVYYNGFRAGEDVIGPIDYRDGGERPVAAPQGARRLGIENMAATCVQGRGVMVDLEAHFGRAHRFVGYDDLMHVLEADKVVIEPGDMVCVHRPRSRHSGSQGQARRQYPPSLLRARWPRPASVAMDHRLRIDRADLRQHRGRSLAGAAHRRRSLRQSAAARPLPVQAWYSLGRDVSVVGSGRLVAHRRPLSFPADGAAAAPARRRRIAGYPGGDGLIRPGSC